MKVFHIRVVVKVILPHDDLDVKALGRLAVEALRAEINDAIAVPHVCEVSLDVGEETRRERGPDETRSTLGDER